MSRALGFIVLHTLALLLVPAASAQEEKPGAWRLSVRMKDLDLARTRLEHTVHAGVTLRNESEVSQRGKLRLVVTVEGTPHEGPWLEIPPLPPGRWAVVRPKLPETPQFQGWRVELEVGEQKYAYTGSSPEAPAELVPPEDPAAELPPAEPTPGRRAGVRGEWFEGGFRVRIKPPDPADPEGKVTVRAWNEGKPLGQTKKPLEKALLKRDAAKVDWKAAPSGFAAWDAAQGEVVLQVLRAEYPEELALVIDVELGFGKDEWRFEQLGPPWTNDPALPAGAEGKKPAKGGKR